MQDQPVKMKMSDSPKKLVGRHGAVNFGKNMTTKKVKACTELLNCTVKEIDAFSGHALRALCVAELIEA